MNTINTEHGAAAKPRLKNREEVPEVWQAMMALQYFVRQGGLEPKILDHLSNPVYLQFSYEPDSN
jgi:hypothetical protein